MNFKLTRIAASVLLAAASSHALADSTAFIYYHPGEATAIETNLATRLSSAGYVATAQSDATAFGSLTGYKQVWDVRGGPAITVLQQSSYLGYLQGGGTMFVMGENSGYGASRNPTVVSLITSAGGGTPVLGAGGANTQTVQGSFAANGVSTVTYAATGGFSSIGNGTCITKDNSNVCSAVAYGVGSLANAKTGTIVTVLDVNFFDSDRILTNGGFLDNLIAYLSEQAAAATAPQSNFVPVSNSVTGGVATTLDGLLTATVINGTMAAAVGQLGALPDDQRALAEHRLTPLANNSQGQAASQSMGAGLSSITRRLDGIRNAGALAWAEPDMSNLQLASVGPLNGLLEAKELRLGAWGRMLGGQTKQDAMDGYAGYKANSWGLTLGADRRLDSGTVVGAAFTYTTADVDQQDFLTGSGNNVKNYQASAYASRDFGKYYLDGTLSYGQQSYSTHRDTQVTGVATAEFMGDIWSARLSAGMPVLLKENITLTPLASIEYERLTQNGYTEGGADVLNLTVDGTSSERVRSALGARIAADTQWGAMKVRPSVHVQWLHDFKNDGINTSASFAGGGSVFATPGQKIASDSGNLGGSLLFSVKKNATLSVSYDMDAAPGYSNQTFQVVGQVWF